MEVLQEWSCDRGVGDICPDHYRDIWHLRPVSADMLSYLASDVEISCPGLLANSTPRNGPNGGTTCVPGGWQTHVPCTGPRESNCRVPDVPQPWAFATGISHYAAYYVLESSHSLGYPPCGNAVRSGGLRIGFGSRILQLPRDHPEVCNYGRNYQLVTAAGPR